MKLSLDQLMTVRKLLEAPSDFRTLVDIARLDPARDFRHADLTGVDFGAMDLGGYDFTGADLRAARLSRAKVSGAIFKDADLDIAVPQRRHLAEYDRTIAFPAMLFWHLSSGTRPHGGGTRRWTIVDFSRAVGVSPRVVARWCRGLSFPPHLDDVRRVLFSSDVKHHVQYEADLTQAHAKWLASKAADIHLMSSSRRALQLGGRRHDSSGTKLSYTGDKHVVSLTSPKDWLNRVLVPNLLQIQGRTVIALDPDGGSIEPTIRFRQSLGETAVFDSPVDAVRVLMADPFGSVRRNEAPDGYALFLSQAMLGGNLSGALHQDAVNLLAKVLLAIHFCHLKPISHTIVDTVLDENDNKAYMATQELVLKLSMHAGYGGQEVSTEVLAYIRSRLSWFRSVGDRNRLIRADLAPNLSWIKRNQGTVYVRADGSEGETAPSWWRMALAVFALQFGDLESKIASRRPVVLASDIAGLSEFSLSFIKLAGWEPPIQIWSATAPTDSNEEPQIRRLANAANTHILQMLAPIDNQGAATFLRLLDRANGETENSVDPEQRAAFIYALEPGTGFLLVPDQKPIPFYCRNYWKDPVLDKRTSMIPRAMQ